MTDNEIIKALKCCMFITPNKKCNECPKDNAGVECSVELHRHALDLINHQKAENDDLFFKLQGVMHFVDKWLDGDELKQDEVNRAVTMREKTLQIVEKQQAEIDELQHEILSCNSVNAELKAENERLATLCTEQNVELIRLQKVRANILNVMKENISQTQSEAIKEFAERLKEELRLYTENNGGFVPSIIDNLVKEMTEQRKEDK